MSDLNRLRDDIGDINKKREDNLKKLKYYTTNNIDLINVDQTRDFYGLNLKDGLFVPTPKIIDESSQLTINKSGNTSYRNKTTYGQLPLPTLPSQVHSAKGNTEIEDSLRHNFIIHKKATNPKEVNSYSRTFSIFDSELLEKPDNLKSVENPRDFGPRGGINSRNIFKKK